MMSEKVCKVIIKEEDDEDTMRSKAKLFRKMPLSVHDSMDRGDVDWLLSKLAIIQGEICLKTFDKLLDPFEMHFLHDQGITGRIWANMVWETPPGVLRVIEDTCAAFGKFSDWENERHNFEHENWRQRRTEIEAENHLRAELLSHLDERIDNYCSDHEREIFEWTRERAIRHWTQLKKNMTKEVNFDKVNSALRKIENDFPEETIPHHFYCPISKDLMRHPVKSNNFTYDRDEIKTWWRTCKSNFDEYRSPMTNERDHNLSLQTDWRIFNEMRLFLFNHSNKI